jgi:hypothetical protein
MLKKQAGKIGIAVTIPILLILHPASLMAQAEEDLKAKTEEGFKQSLDSYFQYMPTTRADGQSGKLGIMRAESNYNYNFKAFDKLPVEFSLENCYTAIKNSTAVKLPAHLVGFITDMETTLPFFNFNNTYLRIGISPSFFGDDWSFRSSTFRIPSRYYIILRPNSKWTYVAGVAYYPKFECDVLPIGGVIYKPNEKLTFHLVPENPNISYMLNDKVTLFSEAGGSFSEYEVTRNNTKSVVLQYREIHIGAGLQYKVNKFIQTSIQGGGVFNRFLKYRDNIGKVDIKNGAYLEFNLEISM